MYRVDWIQTGDSLWMNDNCWFSGADKPWAPTRRLQPRAGHVRRSVIAWTDSFKIITVRMPCHKVWISIPTTVSNMKGPELWILT